MSAASIVSRRRFNPSMDRSDATLPVSTPFPAEYIELAARLVTRKAVSDAERLVFMQQLGIEVTA